ncbi:MAG: glycosyltransferase family 8 protein [Clostridiales bacterium]|nr:glycosyltransferase family 8 protein [Clostridiales bacterium]
MNIVYAANDAYARHLGVSMCSVFGRNRQQKVIRVFVLSMGISGESRHALLAITKRYRRELVFIEMDDLQDRLRIPGTQIDGTTAPDVDMSPGERIPSEREADTGAYDVSVMLRLFMGEVLPEEVNRVIYLDCDTVAVRPLGGLWRTDLAGHVVGAVMEPTIYPAVRESIGLRAGAPYFNSGVLLVDLEQWRKTGVQKTLLDFWRAGNGAFFASDQDVINGALAGRIQILSPKYNFFTNYRYFSYGTLVRHAAGYRAVSREEFVQAKRHPVIIHYMGDERPWIAGNRNHYRRAYEEYLARTPWAGTPPEKGKEAYMLAYHLMDYVTVVCPAVRWEISRRMGMKWANRKK